MRQIRQRNKPIEVDLHLLEVIETARIMPNEASGQPIWVTCEAASRHLSEPVLAHLYHRLAEE